jgi:hypothetical protein
MNIGNPYAGPQAGCKLAGKAGKLDASEWRSCSADAWAPGSGDVAEMWDDNCCRISAACRRCFCRCSLLLSRCYLLRFFPRKARHVRALAERASENARYQRRLCCSGRKRLGQRPRLSVGSPARFAANPLQMQQNPATRPAEPLGRAGWGSQRCAIGGTPAVSNWRGVLPIRGNRTPRLEVRVRRRHIRGAAFVLVSGYVIGLRERPRQNRELGPVFIPCLSLDSPDHAGRLPTRRG